MTALRRLLDTITGGLSALLLASMIVMVTWQVASRYLLNDPSTFTEETLRFGVIWLSLIGAAYVTGRGKHMSVDLIKDMLSPAAQRIINIVIQLGFMAFAGAVLIFGGLRAVNIAWYQTSAVLQVPMGAVYAALPITGVLIVLYSLLNIADLLVGRSVLASAEEKTAQAIS
jgi:TRAP-type C4-dicarboxylate transport system permease small subunit